MSLVSDVPVQPASASAAGTRMLEDVRLGLSSGQKTLPPTWFYDAKGSALFERITRTPEYYLTRVERSLLEREAPSIARHAPSRALVEIGAGSAAKSAILISALRSAGSCETYVPVDVDADSLAGAGDRLRGQFPGLRVVPVEADMRSPFDLPADTPRPLLCAFLGSTIGNFSPDEARLLLARLRNLGGNGGRLLLGADLVKDAGMLERAYNDAEGITAEFNLNVLSVLNRELGADFDLSLFRHRAFYDSGLQRIEMHLVAVADQRITIPRIGQITLAEGETIRTEISCKYDQATLEAMLEAAGFVLERWMEDDARTFALALARAGPVTRS